METLWKLIDEKATDGNEWLVWWPLVELDEEGDITTKPTGQGARVVTRFQGGSWEEPPFLDAVGDWFGDDCCYAAEPSHYAPLPDPPVAS